MKRISLLVFFLLVAWPLIACTQVPAEEVVEEPLEEVIEPEAEEDEVVEEEPPPVKIVVGESSEKTSVTIKTSDEVLFYLMPSKDQPPFNLEENETAVFIPEGLSQFSGFSPSCSFKYFTSANVLHEYQPSIGPVAASGWYVLPNGCQFGTFVATGGVVELQITQ